MNRIFSLYRSCSLILILILFLTSIGCVQSQSLLYKVTGNEIRNPLYIYGTIHALPQSDFFIDDFVMEKFNEAEKIVFEIDMSSSSMFAEVQAAMVMKDNSIADFVTEQELERLKRFFNDSLQLPFDMLSSVKPLLMSSFMLPKLVGSQPASYEGFFVQEALEQGKSMAGLETVAEQIGYMDKIPMEKQVKILLESIDDFHSSRIEFQNLVNVYKSKDINGVYSLMIEASAEYKEFGEFLINERNVNWIPKLIAMANQELCFVAVGCGHLGGEKGILNLLKQRGFEVKPIE